MRLGNMSVLVVLGAVSAWSCGGDDKKAPPTEDTVETCDDEFDNDEDGHVDCDDQDCQIFAICVSDVDGKGGKAVSEDGRGGKASGSGGRGSESQSGRAGDAGEDERAGEANAGGSAAASGSTSSGGSTARGGRESVGGALADGGSHPEAGRDASGGVEESGGADTLGGSEITAGGRSEGGAEPLGGKSSTGGALPSGGMSSGGGSPSNGGRPALGGAPSGGGAPQSGGALSEGGTPLLAGAPSGGGNPSLGGLPAGGVGFGGVAPVGGVPSGGGGSNLGGGINLGGSSGAGSGQGGALGFGGAVIAGSAGVGCEGPFEERNKNGHCMARSIPIDGGYFIDATEVTRGQYQEFLDYNLSPIPDYDTLCNWDDDYAPDSVCMDGRLVYEGEDADHHPVECIDWCDARTYCNFVGKRLCGQIGNLDPLPFDEYDNPETSQWYRACSSAGVNTYPYGDDYDSATCNGYYRAITVSDPVTTSVVGSLTTCQSPLAGYSGVYDLSGNLPEWQNSCESTQPDARCRIGGGAFTDGGGLNCTDDTAARRSMVHSALGFRCCST